MLDLSNYPSFSLAERDRRWARIRELMREHQCGLPGGPSGLADQVKRVDPQRFDEVSHVFHLALHREPLRALRVRGHPTCQLVRGTT